MANDINERLTSFQKSINNMMGIVSNGYRDSYSETIKVYTESEVYQILKSSDLNEKIALSRSMFELDGIYKQLIISMASLLKYNGITNIRSSNKEAKKDTKSFTKRYNKALHFIDSIRLQDMCRYFAFRVLRDGAYYGLVVAVTKDSFGIIDLPVKYCHSDSFDSNHRDLVTFDLSYFDLTDSNELLKRYPKYIEKAYNRYKNGKGPQKIILPVESTLYFDLYGTTPLFLTSIPAILEYNRGVQTELTREEGETRKILFQHMPHLADGRLVFEPPEAEEMHKGAVGMLSHNKNITVLTSYGEAEILNSKTSSDSTYNALEKLSQHIYVKSGVSGQLFAPTGSNALGTSLKNNISIMMTLAQKIANVITDALNYLFSDSNISFKFSFLPISIHNEKELVDEYFKLASAGYSYLYPAAAVGLDARDFVNLKELENDVLNLGTLMVPLSTSYTQSSGRVGAPKKEESEKAEQTIKNEQSKENN